MVESWRDIEGWEGYYQVSDHGNVRSLDRIIHTKNGQTRRHKGRMLKLAPEPEKYAFVVLARNGDTFAKSVHILVMEAFVGPRPTSDHEANHKDCQKRNNSVGNLEWVTAKENTAHAIANGLRTMSSETKEKIRQTMHNYRHTEEKKAKISAVRKKEWADPETRLMRLEAVRRGVRTREARRAAS